MEAAAQRQADSDTAVQQHLSNIANFIAGVPIAPLAAAEGPSTAAAAAAAPTNPGSGSKKRRRQDAATAAAEAAKVTLAVPASEPPATPAAAVSGGAARVLSLASCAVLLGGPLAWLLRLLFSNDSMMDVGGRQQLYREAMRLLRYVFWPEMCHIKGCCLVGCGVVGCGVAGDTVVREWQQLYKEPYTC
jgi:hypothetical protein